MRTAGSFRISNHAWANWRERVAPTQPPTEAMRLLDAFVLGGRVSTRARRWVLPRRNGRRVPLRQRADDPLDERGGSLRLLYNPLLPGVALLLENQDVLTVITDSRPHVASAPVVSVIHDDRLVSA